MREAAIGGLVYGARKKRILELAQKAILETKFGITTLLTTHESSLLGPLAKLSARSVVSRAHRGSKL